MIGMLAALPISAASASGANNSDPRVEQLIQLLQQATQPQGVTPQATVARKGILRFRITFISRSPLANFTQPLRCAATAGHSTGSPHFLFYHMAKDMPISFTAAPQARECFFDLPYDMPLATDTGTINLTIVLHTDHAVQAEADKNVSYQLPLGPIPMPSNFAVTTITRTFNLP
jgi:hypothetical protein